MHRYQPVERVRQILIVLASLILISLLIFILDGRDAFDPVKGVFGPLVSPVSQRLSGLDSPLQGNAASDSELQAQLEQVQAQRDQLLAENARLSELAAEVEQLRAQLGFQQMHPELSTVNARVLGRDPQSLEKYIVINRGANDGIAIGQAVVSPEFLVGQVVEVDPNRARVLLLIDAGFQTGARLQSSRATGIVYGRWQFGERAEMRHIPMDTEVAEGEIVVTSGLSQGIPAGLVIGSVTEVHKHELGNEITCDVLPLVTFEDLQTVTVITSQESTAGP